MTPDERELIIDLRLRGMSVRSVAAHPDIRTTTTTVQRVLKDYLATRAAAYTARTDATLSKLVTRHLAAADSAAASAEQAELDGDKAGATKYLAEERARLQEVAKLSGLYVERIEQTTAVTVDMSKLTDDELKALLGEK